MIAAMAEVTTAITVIFATSFRVGIMPVRAEIVVGAITVSLAERATIASKILAVSHKTTDAAKQGKQK